MGSVLLGSFLVLFLFFSYSYCSLEGGITAELISVTDVKPLPTNLLSNELNYEKYKIELEQQIFGNLTTDTSLRTIEEGECGTMSRLAPFTSLKQSARQRYMEMSQSTCPMYSDCDKPEVRDLYASPFPQNYNMKIEFVVVNDGTPFYNQFDELASVLLTDLQRNYQSANIIFSAQVIKVQLKDSLQQPIRTYFVGAINCDPRPSPCFTPYQILQEALSPIRSSWQQPGSIQVLAAVFQISNLNGYANFPWFEDHGAVVMGTHVLRPTYTTLSHEMGHAFGLYHVFRGISEISSCNDPCYENVAKDVAGDFCSDTAPVARNWICGDVPIGNYPDRCNPTRSSWQGSDQRNYMAYNSEQTCRDRFSEHQLRRIRCYTNEILEGDLPNRNAWNSQTLFTMFVVVLFGFTVLCLAPFTFCLCIRII